jgi:hypothetical protein
MKTTKGKTLWRGRHGSPGLGRRDSHAYRRNHLEEINRILNNSKMTIKKERKVRVLISFNWLKIRSSGVVLSARLHFHKRREVS